MTRNKLFAAAVFLLLAAAIAGCGGATEAGEPDHQAMIHDQPQHHMDQAGEKPASAFDAAPPPGSMAVCPVTKHEFEVAEGTVSSVHEGKTYLFCCPGCKPQFEADPAKFI
jgi:YHS domain-containing protein